MTSDPLLCRLLERRESLLVRIGPWQLLSLCSDLTVPEGTAFHCHYSILVQLQLLRILI